MRARKGQWVKQTGGDSGAWFNGRRWVPFECIGCMYAKGILKPTDRLGGEVFPTMYRVLKTRATDPGYVRHDKDVHNAWLQAGKPIT